MTDNRAIIPEDHPAMPGHFPGHPVVPGVVIIDQVLIALAAAHPGLTCSGIKKMKFLAPLLPGMPFDIEFGSPAETSVRFSVFSADVKLADGRLALRAN